MKSSSVFRFWAPAVLLGATSFAPHFLAAQGQGRQTATQALLDRAHSLEVQGRMDMATQVWQQVLLSDPNNTEALGGLARSAKLSGNLSLASTYLDRLRAINPNDPAIAKVESLETQKDRRAELQSAGKLAQQGQYAQSMDAYRRIYGNTPPPGDVALAYYETEAATEEGRPHAVAGLRSLAAQFPSDSRYQISLGRILTYNPKTRPEGRRLLEAHPNDPGAVSALRQSLLWDSQNPATAGEIRAYLAKHPDAQLQQSVSGIRYSGGGAGRRAVPLTAEQRAANAVNATRNAEDRSGYKALNAKHLEEAEARFKEILANNPDDPNALAGMGYIRMQQANFGGAISFLVQAKQDGSKDPGVDPALNTSRFWYTMGEGAIALNENDLASAEKNYRAALMMRPNSPEALEGIGGTLLKAQMPQAAIPFYVEFVKVKPTSSHAWRGLFMAQEGAGDAPRALQTEHQFPAPVRAELSKDPLFLRALATAYSSVGRDADSQRVLKSALELPFPAGGNGMQADTQLQYAGLLQQANRLEQAAGLYRQVLAKDQNNTAAWQGLVRVLHQMDMDAAALQTIESMPPASYARSMRDPGFESTVASIYQSQKRYDVAQDILEKAIAQQASSGQKVSVPVEIQLAGIYLQRNNSQQAYPLYQKILAENPGNTDAWKGLLSSLHDSGRDGEALSEVRQIPAATRALLENDVAYLQTVGAIYNGLGQPREASIFLRRVQQHYAGQHAVPPTDVDIQNAWLLYNAMNDAGLYRQLMMLGDRTDLTDTQRRTVQQIWTNWAVRRANQSAAAGNDHRALLILNATARAFPDNPEVIKALASGYARAGMSKQAVAIWKAQDLNNASAGDYKAAVGAALAAGDLHDAEVWLRFGLDQYPKDSQMLILGAKFEEARGDTNRAADYYHASLNAMPPSDPGAELATELSQPAPTVPMRLPSNSQPQDLAGLLQPGPNEGGVVAGMPPPYLPGYGNYVGNAPVALDGQGRAYDLQTPQVYQPYTGQPYTGPSAEPAVPSYMSTPHTTEPEQGPKNRLKDYVPQASADDPVPMDGTENPRVEYAAYDGERNDGGAVVMSPAVYQHEQVVRATEAVEAKFTESVAVEDSPRLRVASWTQGSGTRAHFLMARYEVPQQGSTAQSSTAQSGQSSQGSQQTNAPAKAPILTSQPTGTQNGTAQQTQGSQQQGAAPSTGEVYGPYVPYQPPAPVPVQLGTQQQQKPATQPEVTDVLPKAKYVPNAHNRRPASHPSVDAANAAAARRNQSKPIPADSGTGGALSGESHPPADDYNTAAPTEPTVYTGAPYDPQTGQRTQIQQNQIPANQVTQPAVQYPPAQAPQGQVPQGQVSQPQGGYPSSVPNTVQGNGDSYGQQYPQPYKENVPVETRRRRTGTVHHSAAAAAGPAAAPSYQGLSYPGVGQPLTYQPYPLIGPAYPLGEAPTDADLLDQRLPPLRGPYYTGNLRAPEPPLTERQQAERDLAQLEGAYSGWVGGTGSARYRSGTVGLDRLTDLEASFEASITLGNALRLSVIPTAVFLNSGQLNTATSLNPVPLLGTLVGNAAVSPTNQFANGVGGEIQVATQKFAGAVGYTPYEFLIRNVTGRLLFKPSRNFTFYGDRSPVVDTQLSYAGLRDPGSATPVFSGNIWGGVISTGGGIRFDKGDERAGFYITADGADLTGYHVLENYKFEGSMGAYFLAHTFPGYGRLNIGAQLFGMHYKYNELGLTYGLGGYFSPEAYILATVPVTFTGRYGNNFHYTVAGAVGVQSFQQDNEIYFPLDRGLQNGVTCTIVQLATQSCGETPTSTNTGGNYSINSEGAYRIADHWYAGGFVSANNTNNYNTITGGFFVRYLFRPQFGTDDYPTGLFPVQGFRPLRVP